MRLLMSFIPRPIPLPTNWRISNNQCCSQCPSQVTLPNDMDLAHSKHWLSDASNKYHVCT